MARRANFELYAIKSENWNIHLNIILILAPKWFQARYSSLLWGQVLLFNWCISISHTTTKHRHTQTLYCNTWQYEMGTPHLPSGGNHDKHRILSKYLQSILKHHHISLQGNHSNHSVLTWCMDAPIFCLSICSPLQGSPNFKLSKHTHPLSGSTCSLAKC